MTKNAGVKGLIGAFIGVMSYLSNCMNELLVVLAILMIFDYILGIAASFKNGEPFDKNKGIWGAIKKLFYSYLVALGFLADFVVTYIATNVGSEFSTKGVLGIAVTLYLIGTEGHSNIRSLIILGLPVPDFLAKVFGLIKDSAGKLVPINENKLEGGGSDA